MNTLTHTPPANQNSQGTQSNSPGVRTSEVLLSWTAPSHHNHVRSVRWYAIGGALILTIAVYGIVTSAWSVTLVSLLLGGVYFITRREPTALKEIRIETDGVQFQDSFTPWTQCGEFWLVQTPLFTELRIVRKGFAKSDIRIQTGPIDPTVLRSTLSQFLPMRADQREHLLDVIIRLCKL